MISHMTIESPLGSILLVSEDSELTGLYFHGQKHEPVPGPDLKPVPGSLLFHEAATQLAAGLIEDGVLNESDIEGLARQLGLTGRHLP